MYNQLRFNATDEFAPPPSMVLTDMIPDDS
jgi:hypothetical protein